MQRLLEELVLEALRSGIRELEELEEEESWFVSKAVDRMRDAEYQLMTELRNDAKRS